MIVLIGVVMFVVALRRPFWRPRTLADVRLVCQFVHEKLNV
jgi:hypothetical protein